MGLKSVKNILSTLVCFICLAGAAFVAYTCQAANFFFIRPFSKKIHQKVNLIFTNAFLLCTTFLFQKWNRITFKCYGDRISIGPSYLIILNHTTDVDGLLGLAVNAHLGFPYPGCSKGIVKAALGRVPLFGKILQNAGFIFLTRSWNTDRDSFLKSLYALREVKNSNNPLWLCLFPEGTRLTPDKLERSHQYTQTIGLPTLSNVLYPRFKAFTATVECLRNEFDGILDTTFMYEGDVLNVQTALAGTATTTIHTHFDFIPMSEIPQGEEQLQDWLKDRWYLKDKRIQSFKEDVKNLGPADDNYFAIKGRPSLKPFYMLVSTFIFFAALTITLASRIQNGILMLLGSNVLVVILTAVFVFLTVKPSKKGSTETGRRSTSS